MRRLAQAHLDTQLGGAGDQTSNLPVTSQPTLTPEATATLLPAQRARTSVQSERKENSGSVTLVAGYSSLLIIYLKLYIVCVSESILNIQIFSQTYSSFTHSFLYWISRVTEYDN